MVVVAVIFCTFILYMHELLDFITFLLKEWKVGHLPKSMLIFFAAFSFPIRLFVRSMVNFVSCTHNETVNNRTGRKNSFFFEYASFSWLAYLVWSEDRVQFVLSCLFLSLEIVACTIFCNSCCYFLIIIFVYWQKTALRGGEACIFVNTIRTHRWSFWIVEFQLSNHLKQHDWLKDISIQLNTLFEKWTSHNVSISLF